MAAQYRCSTTDRYCVVRRGWLSPLHPLNSGINSWVGAQRFVFFRACWRCARAGTCLGSSVAVTYRCRGRGRRPRPRPFQASQPRLGLLNRRVAAPVNAHSQNFRPLPRRIALEACRNSPQYPSIDRLEPAVVPLSRCTAAPFSLTLAALDWPAAPIRWCPPSASFF